MSHRTLTLMMAATFSSILLFSAVREAGAAAWRVEKDGSGDFEVIQDALDASSPGDSILIGPGRFDTFRVSTSNDDTIELAGLVWVAIPNLTLIGAGRDFTIVGPEIALASVEGLPTCALYVDKATTTRVEGISIEGTTSNVMLRGRTSLVDCRVTRVDLGDEPAILVAARDVEILRTEVVGPNGIATSGGGVDTSNLLVEACRFEDPGEVGTAIDIGHDASDCMVRHCTFEGGAIGVVLHSGGSGWIEDCVFRNVFFAGIQFASNWVIVRRCHIGTSMFGIKAIGGLLEVYDTAMRGGILATLSSSTRTIVRNSHILNAGGRSVMGGGYSNVDILDLRENWWGTADLALIESWIQVSRGTVLWKPILAHAVSTERTSIGELKARFRGHE